MIIFSLTPTVVALDETMEKYLNFKSHYKKDVLSIFELVLPDRASELSYNNFSYIHYERITNNYVVQTFKFNILIFLS